MSSLLFAIYDFVQLERFDLSKGDCCVRLFVYYCMYIHVWSVCLGEQEKRSNLCAVLGWSWPLPTCLRFSVRFMTLFNQKGSIFLLLSPTFDYFLLFPTFSFSSLHFLSLLFSCLLFINVRCVCLGIFGLFCYVVEEKWSNLCWIWILHFRVIVFFVIIISPVELWLLYRIYMYSCLIYMFVYFNFFLLFC